MLAARLTARRPAGLRQGQVIARVSSSTCMLAMITSKPRTMVWGAQRSIDDLVDRLHRQDPSLTSLCLLSGRRFNDEDAESLAEALQKNTVLRELTISSHTVTPAAAVALARALAVNTTLRSIDIGNSSFGDEGVAQLGPGIAASSSLRLLNLEAKGISAAGCPALAEALLHSPLKQLKLGRNCLGANGLTMLLAGLGPSASSSGSGPSLAALDLSACSLEGQAGVQPLASALEQGRLPHLQALRLDGNALGDAGAATLAGVLGSCTTLQALHLQRCVIGPDGAAALASALPSSLTMLDLSGNILGGGGAAALIDAFAASAAPQLQELLLCGAGLDNDSITALAKALASRPPAAAAAAAAVAADGSKAAGLSLDLGGNSVGVSALTALGTVPLSGLCLHDCKLGSSDGMHDNVLAEQLARPGAYQLLQELDMSANHLPRAVLLPLLAALTASTGTAAHVCPHLSLLIMAANPGVEDEQVAHAVECLRDARPGLTVVLRAADTGGGPAR